MIVTCPECLTKFHLEEDRIPEGGASARCSRCRHLFQVQRSAPAEESFFSRGESPGDLEDLERPEETYRSRFFQWRWLALIILLVVVVGGGIYFFGRGGQGAKVSPRFSDLGKYVNEKASALKKVSLSLPFLRKYFGGSVEAEGFISLEKVRGYYLEGNNLNKIFVIEGEVINHWKESRSFIKVKGVLLDSKGKKVKEQEAYCGNILSEKDLKEMSPGAIEKSLASQFGVSFSNVNILPNKSVPFMVVFMDLSPEKPQGKPGPELKEAPPEAPSPLSDFTVEVTSSQKGSK